MRVTQAGAMALRAALLALPSAEVFAGVDDRTAVADINEVLGCMRANLPSSFRVSKFEITTAEPSGDERAVRGQLFALTSAESLALTMKIEAPPELRGMSYLVRESAHAQDVHAYIPSIRRMRRLSGADLDRRIFGTDLSYNELKQLARAFNLAWTDFSGKHDGRPVVRLNLWPQAGTASPYTQVRTLVDRQSCVPLQVNLMDRIGIRNRVTVDAANLQRTDARWFVSEFELVNARERTRTRFRLTDIDSSRTLPSQVFSPQRFYW